MLFSGYSPGLTQKIKEWHKYSGKSLVFLGSSGLVVKGHWLIQGKNSPVQYFPLSKYHIFKVKLLISKEKFLKNCFSEATVESLEWNQECTEGQSYRFVTIRCQLLRIQCRNSNSIRAMKKKKCFEGFVINLKKNAIAKRRTNLHGMDAKNQFSTTSWKFHKQNLVILSTRRRLNRARFFSSSRVTRFSLFDIQNLASLCVSFGWGIN